MGLCHTRDIRSQALPLFLSALKRSGSLGMRLCEYMNRSLRMYTLWHIIVVTNNDLFHYRLQSIMNTRVILIMSNTYFKGIIYYVHCTFKTLWLTWQLCRSIKRTRPRRAMNAHTLWRNLIRGFKYVLPYRSSEHDNLCNTLF